MSRLPLHVTMELHFLKDFLKNIERDLATEWKDIEERNQRGEFDDVLDYEHTKNYPLFRADVGTRAVYYELNALAEAQLQETAESAWLRMNQPPLDDPKKIKTVHGLQFNKIIELIEAEYGVRLSDIEGWNDLEVLREKVNAFKHRKGFKRLKDISKNSETGGYEFMYTTSIEEAERLLERIPAYLENLLSIIHDRTNDS